MRALAKPTPQQKPSMSADVQFRTLILLLFLPCLRLNAQPKPELVPYNKNGLWGYADTNGIVRIPAQWIEARLFNNNSAVVKIRNGINALEGNVFGLIDKKGHYIIGADKGWNGQWDGWRTPLNAVDSTGHWGLIDICGKVLIPFEWDGPGPYQLEKVPLLDSVKAVQKNGLYGIVNRTGKLIVPCVWANLGTDNRLSSIRAFYVHFPVKADNPNNIGVISVDNQELLPARYAHVQLERLAGQLVFLTGRRVPNQLPNAAFPFTTDNKFIAYPSGRELTFPISARGLDSLREYEEPGGFLSFGSGYRGLMNAKRKVVIPCCKVVRVAMDTAFTEESSDNGLDSFVVRRTAINLRTLRPYGPPKEVVYVRDRPRHYEDYGCGSSRRYYNDSEPIELDIDGGLSRKVNRFYKDSLFYTVQNKLTTGPDGQPLYLLKGFIYKNGVSGREYNALVDEHLAYVIKPVPHTIVDFNEAQNIATVSGTLNGRHGYFLMAPNGTALTAPGDAELVTGFRWQGKLYAYANMEAEATPATGIKQKALRVVDAQYRLVPSLAAQKIAGAGGTQHYSYRPPFVHAVVIKDANDRLAYMDLNGKLIYPRLAYKYITLRPLGQACFLANESSWSSAEILVDTAGRPIINGISIVRYWPVYENENRENRMSRLYWVEGLVTKSKKAVYFYVDNTGRAYLDKIGGRLENAY